MTFTELEELLNYELIGKPFSSKIALGHQVCRLVEDWFKSNGVTLMEHCEIIPECYGNDSNVRISYRDNKFHACGLFNFTYKKKIGSQTYGYTTYSLKQIIINPFRDTSSLEDAYNQALKATNTKRDEEQRIKDEASNISQRLIDSLNIKDESEFINTLYLLYSNRYGLNVKYPENNSENNN